MVGINVFCKHFGKKHNTCLRKKKILGLISRSCNFPFSEHDCSLREDPQRPILPQIVGKEVWDDEPTALANSQYRDHPKTGWSFNSEGNLVRNTPKKFKKLKKYNTVLEVLGDYHVYLISAETADKEIKKIYDRKSKTKKN